MNIQRFSRQEIALQQIETALGLYFRGDELFSVITLAGAAEEILGELLLMRGGNKGALASIFRILRPGKKDGLSGREMGHEVDEFVHMDVRHEAEFLLGRAIEDYIQLGGAPSPTMLKFMGERASVPSPPHGQ